MKNYKTIAILFCAYFLLSGGEVNAGGSGMPWENPLTQILDSLTGPVAKVAGVSAIIISGLALAFGEGGGFVRKTIQIVFGVSIAFSASTFFLPFLGFGGGLGM